MVSDQQFLDSYNKFQYYSQVAADLGIHIKTVIARAKKLGVSRTGLQGGGAKQQCELQDILDGKHPQYLTYHLKQRLIKAGILENKCSCCGIVVWNGKSISLDMDHIDGNNTNHVLSNLRLLCPNCHSQTDTFKGRNKKLRRLQK